MMRVIVLALVSACVENPLVICDNGQACPVGHVCDAAHDMCVLPTQLEACKGKDDGTKCSYPGVEAGTCAGGVCFPAVCGGGFLDEGEECDDGNRASGDGCSADCFREQCGNARLDAGEMCDDGDLRSNDGCNSACAPERPGWKQLSLVPLDYRYYPGVAHDAIRQRTVVFAGANAVLAGDTWEFYDETWTSLSTLAGPTKRLAMSLAYDAGRRETVMFGGLINGTLLANDTWVFDGNRWLQRMPATSPLSRNRGAVAYDSKRQRVVLFGGYNGKSLDDLWEWDGAAWVDKTPAMRPIARTATAFTYDPVRGVVLMVGGLDDQIFLPNDFWAWDGTSWTELRPATRPMGTPLGMAFDVANVRIVLLTIVSNTIQFWVWDGSDWARDTTKDLPSLQDGSVVTYDHARDRLVVFGLRPGNILTMFELLPTGWVPVPPPRAPSTRDATAMAYDASRGDVIMFGGRDATSGALGDLWSWTGTRWEELSAVGAPAPRYAHAMAYDAARGELLVVGGRTATGRSGETWAWNGSTWRLAGAMPPHEQFAMAYDPDRGRVVAFGGTALGFDGFDHHVAETWEWNGSSWTEIAIGTGPPGRSNHAMVYDARRKRLVMFGGLNDYQTFNDLWELDGTTWQQRNATLVPPRRSGPAMTYDAKRATTVLMGGKSAASDGSMPLGDTWEWDGTNWTPIATFETPSRHFDRAAAYHAGSGRVVVFGGGASETWLYGYDGPLAPEVCGGGHDVDGDGLVGCDDPDCWWKCTAQCPPHTSCAPTAPRCGDGTCSALEDCRLCAADCGSCAPRCGDFLCDTGEMCPGDCGT